MICIQMHLGTNLNEYLDEWQDLIGCITEPVDFVAGGTCEEQLMGMCETLWEPNMKPDQLFECISQVHYRIASLALYNINTKIFPNG